MSKIVIGKCGVRNVSIDLDVLLRTRLLVQSNSGGGKSWAIRRLCEQAFGKVQIIVIDPEGEFASLREKFGFVLVGQGGETPADTRSAGLLAQRLLEIRASAVCDIYEAFRKSPSQRRAWVAAFLESLVDAPKTLWHPVLVIVDESHKFCLSEDTELLTFAGWKRYREIDKYSDQALCYDMASGQYRWGKVERLIVRKYTGQMVRLKSDGIDCLSTPEHRVVLQRTQRAQGRYKVYPPVFCRADAVPNHVFIPLGEGPYSHGSVCTLSAAFCRLIGWVITDGFVCDRRYQYIAIEQACATTKRGRRMTTVLDELLTQFGGRTRSDRNRKGKNPAIRWYFGSELSRRVRQSLDSESIHRIPRYLLQHGSREQLQSLFDGMLEGDGTANKNGWITFYAGLNEKLADDFQELCVRLGVSGTKKRVPQNGQWVIYISRRRHHYIRHPFNENYSGKVWDITVPTGAFVARRNGKVFVTGNCPQEMPRAGSSQERADIMRCKEAMISLATTGRKRAFCAVWATQRLAKLDKDASAELLNRMVGLTFEDVDIDRAVELLSVSKDEKHEFKKGLRVLEPGNFYAIGRAITTDRVLIRVGGVETTHPEIGSGAQKFEPPPPPHQIKALLPKLADLPKEAEDKARTESEMRREIRELKSQLKSRPPETRTVEIKAVDQRAVERAIHQASREANDRLRAADRVLRQCHDAMKKAAGILSAIVVPRITAIVPEIKSEPAMVPSPRERRESGPRLSNIQRTAERVQSKPEQDNGTSTKLRAGAERMLAALVQWQPNGMMLGQMRSHAGMKKSGTFTTYLSDLRMGGYMEQRGDGLVYATDAGVEYFGGNVPDAPSTTDGVLAVWKPKLREGACRMLDVLVAAGGEPMSREELVDKSGMSKSGTFTTYLSDLRTARLIVTDGGQVRANKDTLFL